MRRPIWIAAADQIVNVQLLTMGSILITSEISASFPTTNFRWYEFLNMMIISQSRAAAKNMLNPSFAYFQIFQKMAQLFKIFLPRITLR